MFSGIVAGTYKITKVNPNGGIVHFTIELDDALVEDLQVGASVAVDGVCLTVTLVEETTVHFDVVKETLQRTTLDTLSVGRLVNIERAARFGDEIGGHILSGHVIGTVEIAEIAHDGENRVVTFGCPSDWMRYILTKGYVALDGASLTVVDTYSQGSFSVTLIPETIRQTTFGFKTVGDTVNLEIDPQTHLIVETVERLLMTHHIERGATG